MTIKHVTYTLQLIYTFEYNTLYKKRLRADLQQIESKACFVYLLLIRQAKRLNTLRASSSSVLGCLCHSLLKMNAQDEQQWREIHAKAITVSFHKAQKIRVIIKLKVLDHCPYQWFHRRGQGALSMVSSKNANEGTGNM